MVNPMTPIRYVADFGRDTFYIGRGIMKDPIATGSAILTGLFVMTDAYNSFTGEFDDAAARFAIGGIFATVAAGRYLWRRFPE